MKPIDDSVKPVEVRLELIGQPPDNYLELPHGKVVTYPHLPRINDFIYYETAWYQVIGVYMYPCENAYSHGKFGMTLKVKFVDHDESYPHMPNLP
jgi:hypothetical protein